MSEEESIKALDVKPLDIKTKDIAQQILDTDDVDRVKDLTNQKFGRLTAKESVHTVLGKGNIWRC